MGFIIFGIIFVVSIILMVVSAKNEYIKFFDEMFVYAFIACVTSFVVLVVGAIQYSIHDKQQKYSPSEYDTVKMAEDLNAEVKTTNFERDNKVLYHQVCDKDAKFWCLEKRDIWVIYSYVDTDEFAKYKINNN